MNVQSTNRKRRHSTSSSANANVTDNSGTRTRTSISSNKKISRQNNHNKNHSNCLLIKLSEGCNKHYKNWHKNDHEHKHKHELDHSYSHIDISGPGEREGSNQKNVKYEHCEKDLNTLKNVIPKVEAAYKLPYSASTGSSSSGGKKGSGGINPVDMSNLCMFYHNIVMGTFCPHSKQILLQNGEGGVEIFPRVHELCRYLASTQIIKNTISTLSAQQQEQQQGDDASSTQKPNNNVLIADQISFTSCILLHAIPSTYTKIPSAHSDTDKNTDNDTYTNVYSSTIFIIKDLINLLFDLSVISSSDILETLKKNDHNDTSTMHTSMNRKRKNGDRDGNHRMTSDYTNDDTNVNENVDMNIHCNNEDSKKETIELVILNEAVTALSPSSITNNSSQNSGQKSTSSGHNSVDNSQHEYIIELESMNALLSLQSGTFHVLFKFLVLQYQRRHSDINILQELDSTSVPTTTSSATNKTTSTAASKSTPNGEKGNNTAKMANFAMTDDPNYFAPFMTHNELRSSILACIRQVLETNLNVTLTTEDGKSASLASLSPSSLSTIVLSLRNKVFASNLFLLLLPDLSILANEGDVTITSTLWFELMSLVTNSVHAHYLFMADTLIPLIQQHTKRKSNQKGHSGHPYHPLCQLSTSLSSMLVSLMTNVFMCPFKPFNPSPYTMWSLRSKVICRLYDCIHYIDKLMMNEVHHSSSTFLESIKDLSLVTLRAIQITFFPDVMITDSSCAPERNEERPKETDDDVNREYEIIKLMIREHCSTWNIYPILFNLLQDSSVTTLVISIIVHLTSSNNSSNCTEQLILCHACEVVLQKEFEGKFESEITGNKKKRVLETNDYSMIDREMKDVSMDGIINSSFALALTNFVHLSLKDAKQVIETIKSYDQTSIDSPFSHISTIEAASITSSIRLIHSFLGFDSCHTQRGSPLSNKSISTILTKFYEAGITISNYIARIFSSENLPEDLVHNVTALLELLLGILSYSRLVSHPETSESKTERLRTKLVSSLSNTAMLYWSNAFKLEHNKFQFYDSKEDDFTYDFDCALVNRLHHDQINQLRKLFKESRRDCHGICKRVESAFGMSTGNKKKRFCGFVGNKFSNKIFQNYCAGLLIEENYSLQQRCIFLASFHLNLSSKEGNQSKSLLFSFHDSFGISNPTLTQKLSYFSFFPNLILSLTLKTFADTSDKLLPTHFVDVLREIKYQEHFYSILDGSLQNEEISQIVLRKQAFECFTKVVSAYNFVTKISQDKLGNANNKLEKRNLMEIIISSKFDGPYAQIRNLLFEDHRNEAINASSTSLTIQLSGEDNNLHFSDFIIDVMKRISSIPDVSFDNFALRKAKWDLIMVVCFTIPVSKLRRFASYSPTNGPQDELQFVINDSIKTIPLLRWLVQRPFIDSDDTLRYHCADRIGPLLLSNNGRMLSALYEQNLDECNQCDLAEKLFNEIDELLAKHCGVMQSALSLTMRTTVSTYCTSNSTWSYDAEEIFAMGSRQISSILAISAICHSAKVNNPLDRAILEQGIMRLVRMWTILPESSNDLTYNTNRYNHERVSLVAFQELIKLNRVGVFCQKMIEGSGNLFLPGLFSELLSRGIIQQNVYGQSNSIGFKDYEMLIKLIQTFFLQTKPQMNNRDSFDNIVATVNYVDRVLPSVITGLIIGQDFDTLCACTGFRIHLLAEVKRMEKKVIGISSKKRPPQLSEKELKKQTSNLCRSDEGVKVLNKVLPSLLMETDKSPLLFYLKTVLQSEFTLGKLVEMKELKIIEEIVWEIGGEETERDDDDDDDFTIAPKAWLESMSNSRAIQGLKKGAIMIKQVSKKTASNKKRNETSQCLEGLNSIDIDDSGTESSKEAEKWIHKHFMMLLVKCVTIRWKRGRIETKIRAVKCLRLLIRFLSATDSPQYITQVLTMIDSVMNFKYDLPEPLYAKSRLQLLATKALAHFVHVLLLHQVESVGENLCKIIVSIFPLFDNVTPTTTEASTNNQTDLYINAAISQAVRMMECLSEGENGRRLKSYFMDVPFLPKHPLLQHVRESLKRNGVDFDHFLFIGTQLSVREIPSSTSSSGINDKLSHQNALMQAALRRRLHCLKRLFNHENDNVRRIVLQHLTNLIRGNRDLFHNLVKTEDASLQFLTIHAGHQSECNGGLPKNSYFNGESMKSFLDGILHRCIAETNTDIRLTLAKCLGEIGAIDPKYLGDDLNFQRGGTCLSNRWMFENGAPWKSKSVKVHCELQLVTRHFVAALKAAPTPTDQHKIAFAIQEVLKTLDESASTMSQRDKKRSSQKKEMNPWLRDKLEQAEVLNIIEPYWSSLYKQKEASKGKNPPFFKESTSYYNWLSAWGRFMIESSHKNDKSRYNDLFYACRSAIRSEAGIGILEFLLPLLVLDTICFGGDAGRVATADEMRGVLSCCLNGHKSMDKMELQKAIAVVFMIIETFQSWADVEIEDRFSSQRSSKSYNPRETRNSKDLEEKSDWPSEISVELIGELLKKIKLSLCAKAAAHAGMFAQSLRFLEVQARKSNANDLYDATVSIGIDDKESIKPVTSHLPHTSYGQGIDLSLAHLLFGELNDCDSMNAVSKCRRQPDIIENIREKEAYTDWDGVLRLCEQASQIRLLQKNKEEHMHNYIRTNSRNTESEYLDIAYLKALLELGQLDSAFNQVRGMLPVAHEGGKPTFRLCNENVSMDLLVPYAVQASWRLSRWDALAQLLNVSSPNNSDWKTIQKVDLDGQYNMALGRSMLNLHKKNETGVMDALENARKAIIPPLSVVARENYIRTYPYLLKLHCLREIEDSCGVLCQSNSSDEISKQFINLTEMDWGWKARLDTAGTNTSASIHIITTRLALARLSSNLPIEASLWLDAGKRARKGGLYHVAENCLSHADAIYQHLQAKCLDEGASSMAHLNIRASEVSLQLAKIKHSMGKSTEALLMVRQEDFDLLQTKTDESRSKAVDILKKDGRLEFFARRALQATEWMVESGLKSGSEVMARYRLLNDISPGWERAHFKFAKYLNSVLDSRINVLSQTSGNVDDDSVRNNIILRDSICQKYILNSMKQYGEALSLSQKHVFQALPRFLTLWFDFTSIDTNDQISANQEAAISIAYDYLKKIPAISYYSVLPQLISRIGHSDDDTAVMVVAILKRVLTKFPAQAMWHLAWLRQSVHKDRQKKGDEIFKSAQKNLHRNEKMKMHDLLEASKELFKFLIDLAKYQPKRADQNLFNVHQWQGKVDLKEFMPPVQAALTVSRNAVGIAGSSEAFPKCVPRMRAFSTQVTMMSSKARPKKLTAFAIPEGSKTPESTSRNTSRPMSGDIGEMHFLVKREARGDLRKDARVQDLNTVINRLLSSSSCVKNTGKRQHRRLHLRTFAVTCLSEDCGILEWVPQTDSLRNLVSSSYHPHASRQSIRRRGKRMTDFADMKLRGGFMKCQEQYLKHGNLTQAVQMFDFFLKDYPPLLYWWFLHQFQDPHKWFEARTKFALSSAAWSAVGHVIGLGDRHSENILVDTSNGDCVHVDFDCIFDKGLHLPRPEVVPFRLTPNMLDAFGPTGADGAFAGGLSASMKTLRDNRDILLSVLEPFLKDPVIDWKRQRTQQKQGTTESSPRESMEAKRSIRVIEQRLKGMYNLRNPNLRKIRRVDGRSIDDDDEMARLLPLSVEGQVHKMITEASSHENLVQLYVGWMPWL